MQKVLAIYYNGFLISILSAERNDRHSLQSDFFQYISRLYKKKSKVNQEDLSI
jgi:hypothetical protein